MEEEKVQYTGNESHLEEESRSQDSNALVDLTPEQIKTVDTYFKGLHEVLKLIRRYWGDINTFMNKHCCVFIGNTGAGKSTTVNGLIKGIDGMEAVVRTKDNMFGEVEDTSYEPKAPLFDSSGRQVFDVSNSTESCTKYINAYSHEDVLYCDCPGLEDTCGVDSDTANAILIGRLFQASSTVTLVVLIDYHSIHVNRGTMVTQLMKTVTSLLENPSEMVTALKHMIFCVTKVPESTQLPNVKQLLYDRLVLAEIPEDALTNIIDNNVFVIHPTDSLPEKLGTKMAAIKEMITERQLYLDSDSLKIPVTLKMEQIFETNLAEGQQHILRALQKGDVPKAKAIIAIFQAMSQYIPKFVQAVDVAQAYIHQYELNLADKEKGEQAQHELMMKLKQQEVLVREKNKQQQQILAKLAESEKRSENFLQIIDDENRKREMLDQQQKEELKQAEEARKEELKRIELLEQEMKEERRQVEEASKRHDEERMEEIRKLNEKAAEMKMEFEKQRKQDLDEHRRQQEEDHKIAADREENLENQRQEDRQMWQKQLEQQRLEERERQYKIQTQLEEEIQRQEEKVRKEKKQFKKDQQMWQEKLQQAEEQQAQLAAHTQYVSSNPFVAILGNVLNGLVSRFLPS